MLTISIERGAAPVEVRVTEAGVQIGRAGTPLAPPVAGTPARRFRKVSADGRPLDDGAADWAAVVDLKSGLMWTATQINEKGVTQEKACELAPKCELLGFKDWRLPTIDELETLRDRTRFEPAIDTGFFRNIKSDWYWSATTVAGRPDYAWSVYFSYGHSYWDSRDGYLGFVLACRGAGQTLDFWA